MKINEVFFSDWFLEEFDKLSTNIQENSILKLELFKANPFHPSLRLHKLGWKLDGLWSISINMKYRIIFKPQENWNILLISIWTHSIYER